MQQNMENEHIQDNEGIEGGDNYMPTSKLLGEQPLVVYKRRWLMLLIFSLNAGLSAEFTLSLSTVNIIAREYYSVPSTSIEWLSNMIFLMYIIFCIPMTYAITKLGIRWVLLFAAFCDVAASVLNFIGHEPDKFVFLFVGQVFTGFALSSILQMPGKLSAMWFPEHEQATATSIGVVSHLIGVAMGHLHPALVIRSGATTKNDLKMYFIVKMVEAFVILVVTMFYQENPPTAPSVSADIREYIGFKDSIKMLSKNRNYIILALTYGIMLGLSIAISILLNPLVTSSFPKETTNVGMMGCFAILVSSLSFLFFSRLLDKYRNYKTSAVILTAGACSFWLGFILLVTESGIFKAAYAIYVIFGVFMEPFASTGIEQAAEITYPVSEETSTTIMTLLGNVFGFASIFGFGSIIQAGYMKIAAFVIAGFYFIAFVLTLCTKTELKRSQAGEEDNEF